MKTFLEYIKQNTKTYDFRIAIAGDRSPELTERLRVALKKYGIVNMGGGKTTPIQPAPLEFPHLANTAITHYDVSLRYPTAPSVLEGYLGSSCDLKPNTIRVRNSADPLNIQQEQPESETYVSLLDTTEMGGESAQESVGENRVMALLKELEAARKQHEPDAARSVKYTPPQ
jgi:hypothetical protein